MSENILYKFAKDLSQLYAKIRVKDVEACFLKVAQFLDSEVESFLQKAAQLNYKSSLQNPVVLDTLILLNRLKKTYVAGIDASAFVRDFMNDPKLTPYIPTIASLREAANSNDFAILSPYKNILDASRHIPDVNAATGTIAQDVRNLDTSFREEMDVKINKPYSEEPIRSTKKPNKKEKIDLLLRYLLNRFSKELASSLEQTGQIDVLGIAEDDNVLRDPMRIINTIAPNYPPANIASLIKQAKNIVKEILPYTDPSRYDYVYNYIKGQLMLWAGEISFKDYTTFMYHSKLNFHTFLNKDSAPDETEPFEINKNAWKTSNTLILLSTILYTLGSKT